MIAAAHTRDVLVVGAGPAGLLIAAACAREGLDVAVIAPRPAAPWAPRYAAWLDELTPAGLEDTAEHRWPEVLVRLDADRQHVLARPYVALDGAALQRRLIEQLGGAGRLLDDRVLHLQHPRREASAVQLASGQRLHARIVIDASGPQTTLLERPHRRVTGWQTAWGVLTRASGAALPPPGRATLMDLSGGGAQPTFLYAMHLGEDRYFLEETVLIGRPAVPHTALRDRLHQRLQAAGITLHGEPEATERCTIPLDLALPSPKQRTLGFGAAASMIHPATGYQLGFLAATAAPRLAAAIAQALRPAHVDPAEVAEHGWEAALPDVERRAHAIYTLGAHAVARFDAPGTRAFFDAFFELPQAEWAGFLGRTLTPSQLIPILWHIYRRCPGELRGALRGAFLHHPALSAHALLGLKALAPSNPGASSL